MTDYITASKAPGTGEPILKTHHRGHADVWLTKFADGRWKANSRPDLRFGLKWQFNRQTVDQARRAQGDSALGVDCALATAEAVISRYFPDRDPAQVPFDEIAAVAGTVPPPTGPIVDKMRAEEKARKAERERIKAAITDADIAAYSAAKGRAQRNVIRAIAERLGSQALDVAIIMSAPP